MKEKQPRFVARYGGQQPSNTLFWLGILLACIGVSLALLVPITLFVLGPAVPPSFLPAMVLWGIALIAAGVLLVT
jgi:hypothetical protein